MELTIRGLQEAQKANEKVIAAVKPRGALGRAVQIGTTRVHRYAVGVSHVDTGAMRASHRMEVRGLGGRVFLDRAARNPRGSKLTHEYGYYEHQRGGSHAFYLRTVAEAGRRILREMEAIVRRGLP